LAKRVPCAAGDFEMLNLCRYFGHRASNRIQRDPMTFALHGECRRCAMPLVRDRGEWLPDDEFGIAQARMHQTAA
jgi:hypothetical protein